MSFVQRNYPMDAIERAKQVIEESYINELFGSDFYDILKADVNDWTQVNEYVSGTSYSLNDIVFWKGLIKKSKVNTNTHEPTRFESSYWKDANKFDSEKLTELWDKYLCRILANKVIISVATIDTIRMDAKGMVISTDDNSNMTAADPASMSMALKAIINFNDTAQAEMIRYIKSEYKKYQANSSTGYDYSTVSFIGEDIRTQNSQTRKIMYRY
jgi:hypothetical protein